VQVLAEVVVVADYPLDMEADDDVDSRPFAEVRRSSSISDWPDNTTAQKRLIVYRCLRDGGARKICYPDVGTAGLWPFTVLVAALP
jgi:hypothetical protein